MKRFIVIGASIAASLIIVGMAFALSGQNDRGSRNRNDPTRSWTANACFPGGSLAGTCDTVEEWIAGWFLIRYEYGLISLEDFPRRYRWILPTNTPAPSTATYTATNTLSAPSSTPTNTATNTLSAPSSTPTDTPTNTYAAPSSTPTDTATNTEVPSTNTPTNTATNTEVPPTNTPTNTATPTETFTPTNTATP